MTGSVNSIKNFTTTLTLQVNYALGKKAKYHTPLSEILGYFTARNTSIAMMMIKT